MNRTLEVFCLPLLFLTVTLLGGLRVDARVVFAPPPLSALVLAILLIAALVRCGAVAPERLLHADRRHVDCVVTLDSDADAAPLILLEPGQLRGQLICIFLSRHLDQREGRRGTVQFDGRNTADVAAGFLDIPLDMMIRIVQIYLQHALSPAVVGQM